MRNAASHPYKIMVVDDHPMMRAGLAGLLNEQPDMKVCCEAESPACATTKIRKCHPDLILADLTFKSGSGLGFIRDVVAAQNATMILVVSMHDEGVYAERALRAGARGYIMKEESGKHLVAAARQVLGGGIYLSKAMRARMLSGLATSKPHNCRSPLQELTNREFEVYQLLGQGKATREIAQQLHRSPKTVDAHRANIKQKLQLKNSIALVQHAVQWVETETPQA